MTGKTSGAIIEPPPRFLAIDEAVRRLLAAAKPTARKRSRSDRTDTMTSVCVREARCLTPCHRRFRRPSRTGRRRPRRPTEQALSELLDGVVAELLVLDLLADVSPEDFDMNRPRSPAQDGLRH